MEIGKHTRTLGIGAPDQTELALINRLTRRELAPEEVYTFALRLCDNDIDRDFERFDDQALEDLAQRFVGVAGIFDHQWSARGQTARIYRAQVQDEPGSLTRDGRPYRFLKAWAYMMRTQENQDLIAEIDGGIKREVSVGCAVEHTRCSICGEELEDCPHEKGREYQGALCCGVLCDVTDAYEWSFVAVPAQTRAGVVKCAARRDQEARLGRKYLKELRRELVRLAGLAEPALPHALLLKTAGKLDEEELRELIRLLQRKNRGLLGGGPQLSYGPEPHEEEAQGAFLI